MQLGFASRSVVERPHSSGKKPWTLPCALTVPSCRSASYLTHLDAMPYYADGRNNGGWGFSIERRNLVGC